ncbi:MAG TPA: dienelactone hydrolase family protein [Xanthomonadales bacterium]|nr:dienelactone hydrolase family protein [Xanthomonadales bacterium]
MLRTILAMASLIAATANAAVVERKVSYSLDGTEFESTLVYDDASATARPGLVLVPNWYGAGDAAVAKAKTIAGKDYVILVADVYGKDVRPTNDQEAGAAAGGMYKDRNVLRARAAEALKQLRAQAGTAPIDTKHIGAIGFCFGGATALELARSGADIAGVATFHAALNTDMPAQAGAVQAKVLVQNGADDTYVTPEHIASFQKEMKDAAADWTFVNHSGAVHCFAEPDAKSPPGCLYNERAAKRSFALMHDFFAEAFGN